MGCSLRDETSRKAVSIYPVLANTYLIKLRIRAGCARNTYPTSAHRPPASHGTSRKGPHTAEEVAARAVGRKHPPVSGEKRSLCTLGVPLGRSRGIGGCTRAPCVFLAAAEGTARRGSAGCGIR